MNKILAFGANGPIAGLVLPELARRNTFVRAFVRGSDQALIARRNGASEVAFGDLADADSVRRALTGITSIFYIAPLFLADQASIGQRIVNQAIESGVKRFVFSSVIHPVLSSLPNHAEKAPVEEAVLHSDLEFTFLHPTALYQNYGILWPGILASGAVGEPWSVETRHSRVDYRDVAEVAAIALTEDRLVNGTFELCAEGMYNRKEIAVMLSEILGRAIEARQIDPSALGSYGDLLGPMFNHYDHYSLRGNDLILRAILGREPRTLRAYFKELAATTA
jgi:uncharacterized protein YbjT (DUF2867 family)